MREGLGVFVIVALSLFFGILLFLEIGRRIGLRRKPLEGAAEHGFRAIEGSVIALLGLMIAFTFSAAAHRFDERREMIVREVQAIETAWLRISSLSPQHAPVIRNEMRRYFDARLDAYAKMPNLDAVERGLDDAHHMGVDMYVRAMQFSITDGMQTLLMPAMNDLLDSATERTLAFRLHTPAVIFAMLAILALAASLMIGMHLTSTGRQHTFHTVAYALAIATTIYLIIDLEYPRLGLIRVNLFDRALVKQRLIMGPIEPESAVDSSRTSR